MLDYSPRDEITYLLDTINDTLYRKRELVEKIFAVKFYVIISE